MSSYVKYPWIGKIVNKHIRSWDFCPNREPRGELIAQYRTPMSFLYNPDSKVHGADMRPTWDLSAPDGPHVGPMNLNIRESILRLKLNHVGKREENLMWMCRWSQLPEYLNFSAFQPLPTIHRSCIQNYFCQLLTYSNDTKLLTIGWITQPFRYMTRLYMGYGLWYHGISGIRWVITKLQPT